MKVAAFVISCCAFAMSGASLGWQVAAWLLSGGRAKATLVVGVAQADGGAYIARVTKTGEPGMDPEQLRAQGIGGSVVVGIQVANHGRAPLTVERVDVCTRGGGGATFQPLGILIGPDLPHRLEPGANATWLTPADAAYRLVEANREVLKVRASGVYMTAELGTGKTVATSQTLRA